MFAELCSEHLPHVEKFHISDDSLIKDVVRHGVLPIATSRRVLDHILAAESAGADRILVTCSSIGPAVEAAQAFVGVPVLRVDRPMAENAVAMGNRIGVAATLPTTLGPAAGLIQRCGVQAGRPIELTTELCEGAFVRDRRRCGSTCSWPS